LPSVSCMLFEALASEGVCCCLLPGAGMCSNAVVQQPGSRQPGCAAAVTTCIMCVITLTSAITTMPLLDILFASPQAVQARNGAAASSAPAHGQAAYAPAPSSLPHRLRCATLGVSCTVCIVRGGVPWCGCATPGNTARGSCVQQAVVCLTLCCGGVGHALCCVMCGACLGVAEGDCSHSVHKLGCQ
jgi:hypothetical protein